LADVEDQLRQESIELASKEASLNALRDSVQALQERQRAASDAAQQTARRHTDLDARAQALAALQAKIGQSKDSAQWQEQRGLARARRLWQGLDIEAPWEGALEAVAREGLHAH